MTRRAVQTVGSLALIASLATFLVARCSAVSREAQGANKCARTFLATIAGAQELYRRDTGHYACGNSYTVYSTLASGGYFGSQFAALDGKYLESFTITGRVTPDGQHFEWRAEPKWWLVGRALHWYVSDDLMLRSRLLGEAGPDAGAVEAVEINWCRAEARPN